MSVVWKFHLAVGGLLMVVGLWLYWPTLDYPFVFDDRRNITEAPHIHITALTAEQLLRAGRVGHLSTRPVAKITYALNYWASGGLNPRAFRLTNIWIHIVSALAVYCLGLQLLGFGGSGKRRRSGIPRRAQTAAACALLWLVHPMQVQSVTYIVQRMNSLAVMFCLLSVCAYIAGRNVTVLPWRLAGFAGAAASGLLALGCKENAAMLPVLLFLAEWVFYRDVSWPWLRRQLLFWIGPLALLGAVVLVSRGFNPWRFIESTYALYDFTPGQRLLTQPRVVFLYAFLLLLPLPQWLSLEHGTVVSTSLLSPWTTVPAIMLLLAAIGAALWLLPRRRFIAFCLLWFFLNLFIESSFIGLEMVYEYRVYMPSVTLLLGLLHLGFSSWRAAPWQRLAAVLPVAVLLCLSTRAVNYAWRSEIALWQDVVEKAPNLARPYYNLATWYVRAGDPAAAIPHFRRAIELDKNYAMAEYNLGFVLEQQGDTAEAEQHYRRALEINPDYTKPRVALGTLLRDRGDSEAAIEQLKLALSSAPNTTKALSQLAFTYASRRDYATAVEYYERYLQLVPGDHEQRRSLANIYAFLGRADDAVRELRRLAAALPADAEARYSLGRALERQDDRDAAMSAYRELLRLQPDHAEGKGRLQALESRPRTP